MERGRKQRHPQVTMSNKLLNLQGQTSPTTTRTRLRQTRVDEHHTDQAEGTVLWGDDPLRIERIGCRLMCQNVNGKSRGEHYTKATEIGEAATTQGVNILGLNETNTDWKIGNAQTTIRNILRKFWKDLKMCFSSSNYGFNTDY